jgi:hypothetical protein
MATKAAAAFVLGLAQAILNAAPAADLRPSWECLPEGTAAMVRMPRPTGFLDTLRTRTKLGAVVLGPDRIQKAWALAVEAWEEADDTSDESAGFEESLAKYGLGPADIEAVWAGDMGAGLVILGQGGEAMPLVLAWMEPGAESATRLVAAVERLVEEAAGSEFSPQRVDEQMAGHTVMWVRSPIVRAELGKVSLDGEAIDDLRAKLAELAKNAPKVVTGTQHLFMTRLDGRLLLGMSLPTPPQGEPDPARGADEARAAFERFLAAHASGEAAPLAEVIEAPAMRAALPDGEPIVDAFVDPRPIVAAAANPEVRPRLASIGLADLGPIGMRLAFDAGLLRQGLCMTLPAPRAGLMRILDQDCDPAEVPSFVTSEAVSFTQLSLDLAAAYRSVKEFAVAEMGDQATNLFATAEAQAQAWLGVELERMLANVGSRHWIVTYPPQVAAALEEARRNREAADASPPPMADRTAFVWKLADDAPVLALMPKVAALAQAQVVEEQGFQGIRLPGGTVSVFAGQGHLVVGLGGDALEKTLAGIRNPPAGAASLREGGVPQKAAELVPLGEARMFSVGDLTRPGGMLGELREAVAAMIPDDVEEDSREILTKAQALLPGADEMEGMFGVGATVMEVNDAGVVITSAWEMPAP